MAALPFLVGSFFTVFAIIRCWDLFVSLVRND